MARRVSGDPFDAARAAAFGLVLSALAIYSLTFRNSAAAPARGVLIPAPGVKDTEPSISRPPFDSSSAEQGISPGPSTAPPLFFSISLKAARLSRLESTAARI